MSAAVPEPDGTSPLSKPDPTARWRVYVLVSARADRTYVGVSADPERRLAQHNGERAGGARSTRAGRPWRLAAVHGPYASRGDAQSVERRLQKLRGRRRLACTPADLEGASAPGPRAGR